MSTNHAATLRGADAILQASKRAIEKGRRMPVVPEMRVLWDVMRPEMQAVMNGAESSRPTPPTDRTCGPVTASSSLQPCALPSSRCGLGPAGPPVLVLVVRNPSGGRSVRGRVP